MAWRAVRALGLPCRLVKGQEIAEGAFLRKPGPGEAALLLVPGGNARLKAQALGPDGLETVRRWVAQGGRYLGFCGGAGLALRHENAAAGLNLCPWMRAAYPQRLHHLISGHVRVRLRADDPRVPPELTAGQAADAALPVWWPGRFAPEAGEDVRVLAAYDAPGEDFWLADLPLRRIPAQVFETWQALYGVNLSADFLAGQPLVVGGAYGAGGYILSYSHLETPDSRARPATTCTRPCARPRACRLRRRRWLTGARSGRVLPRWKTFLPPELKAIFWPAVWPTPWPPPCPKPWADADWSTSARRFSATP